MDASGRNSRSKNPIKKRRGTQPHLTTEDEESEDDVNLSLKSMPEGRDFDSAADDDDIDSISSCSSGESLTYKVGYLDDPEIRMGKHRTNYLGDSATGCIVSSNTLSESVVLKYCNDLLGTFHHSYFRFVLNSTGEPSRPQGRSK